MFRRRAKLAGGVDDSALYFAHREKLPDNAGGARKDIFHAAANAARCKPAHLDGILLAARARAGIGVSRIDDDAPQPAARDVQATNLYRRGEDLVRREHCRSRRKHIADEQSNVRRTARALDPRMNAGGAKPARGKQMKYWHVDRRKL